jgi:hypothetical protein
MSTKQRTTFNRLRYHGWTTRAARAEVFGHLHRATYYRRGQDTRAALSGRRSEVFGKLFSGPRFV